MLEEKPTDKRFVMNYLSILPNYQSLKSIKLFISFLINYYTFLFNFWNISEPSSYSKGLVLTPEKFKVAIFIFDFQICSFSRRSRFSIRSSKLPVKKKTSIKLFILMLMLVKMQQEVFYFKIMAQSLLQSQTYIFRKELQHHRPRVFSVVYINKTLSSVFVWCVIQSLY